MFVRVRYSRKNRGVIHLHSFYVSVNCMVCSFVLFYCFVQIILLIWECTGGWMTFVPDWLVGSPSLSTSNPLHLIVYLTFANGVWVVIPLLLAIQSWQKMVWAAKESRIDTSEKVCNRTLLVLCLIIVWIGWKPQSCHNWNNWGDRFLICYHDVLGIAHQKGLNITIRRLTTDSTSARL